MLCRPPVLNYKLCRAVQCLLLASLAVFSLFIQDARAVSTLPVYESFPTNYANNARLRDIAAFDAGNSAGSGSNLTNSWTAGLSYPGLLAATNTGGCIANGTPSSSRDAGFQLSPNITFTASTNTLYGSFLLNVATMPTTTNLLALLAGGTGGGTTPVAGVFLDNQGRLWLSKSSSTPTTNTAAVVSLNTTYLLVFRYQFNVGGNDEAALWLNPGNLGDTNNIPIATLTTTNGNNSTSVVAFDLAHRTASSGIGGSGLKYLDEIRVGTSWADVTPTGSTPPPVTNGQPYITQTLLTANGVVLSGTNGPANGAYQVLGSTNVATPLAQWPVIGANSFDATGDFICTNPIAPGNPQLYYRVRVGTNGPVSPVAPGISSEPAALAVAVGQNALFSVTATGAPLNFQWFFNTNTSLANATNTALTIVNSQLTNAGKYSVTITNSAGTTNSVFATLTVTNVPPAITTQPSNQTVTVGQNASFTVAASGTAPLTYQWFFNTNTALVNATNAALTIVNSQFTNAGKYSVVVSNVAGTATSTFATLTVNSNSGTPDFSMVGFATLNGFSSNSTLLVGGTTGGAAGPLVLVSNVTQLKNYAQVSNQTLRILILTNIDMSSLNNNDNPQAGLPMGKITINNNKTIYSTNGATISRGSFHVISKSNVIIRNLKFRDMFFENSAADPGYDAHDWDYVRVDTSHHVWVDHCDFEQVYDGMVDVKDRGDYVTVSWCVFRNQKKCNLIGSDDSATADRGHLNVTFHHNWYFNVDERTPRMRFGNAHVFNMYYSDTSNSGKCIQSTAEAATLVENTYFANALGGCYPTVYVNGGLQGNFLKVVDSTIVNSSGNHGYQQLNAASFSFNAPFVTNQPPYVYTLDATASVPGIVTNWAGVGKITSF